ncbi:MAG: thiamine pyrophosphate-binding protein [Candidatus Altiarchaeota archaeon]|nr:thiamine pyrophosphate-binding protein [Candidatus Altiarchaeota archaeon]
MTTVSDCVMKFVADRGVKHLFMLSGGGCMHLVDAVGRCREIEYVCNLHEQACSIAAEAYGQYTNNLGVALVTTGPGGTNAVTGVAGAWLDSIPCLYISGQVKRPDMKGNIGVRQLGFQEIGIVDVVSPITKYAVCITDPKTVRHHLEKAVYLAKSGRPGPVWVDIPLDVQAAEVEWNDLRGFKPEKLKKNTMLYRQVNDAIGLLNESERPVLLAGNGIRHANASGEFLRLVKMLNIPVLTTWKAADLIAESHPLYVGRPGAIGQRGANFAQQNSDLFLSIGARLDLGQTAYSHKNFARMAKKVVVDVDSSEIKKLSMSVDVPVCSDAGEFINEFIRQSDKVEARGDSGWLKRCKEWQMRYPVVLPKYWSQKRGVSTYVLVDVLSDEMPRGSTLVPGSSGACSEITLQAFRVKEGVRVFNTPGLGSMGYGIPAAIGGCLASGSKKTVCIEGDGGFVMNIQELETVKRIGLPIKFFVLDNGGYGSIMNTQRNYFSGRLVGSDAKSSVTLPDVKKVAKAFGIKATCITNHKDIRRRVRSILDSNGAVVCEVKVASNELTAPRVTSMRKPDGTMVSKPMEDLWPLLGRDEFAANMLVPPVDE